MSDTRRARLELLQTIDKITERPLAYLSVVWVVVIILELAGHTGPSLQHLDTTLWLIFIADFVVEISIAPKKFEYLKSNWLIVLSLFLPILRVLRILSSLRIIRAARVVRSVSLLKIVSSLNHLLLNLRDFSARYGVKYIFSITLVILFTGAAGIYYFENPTYLRQEGIDSNGISTYGDALWWSAMLMTTIGSEYWPRTAEGKLLTFILSLYSVAIFGYITATLASLFVKNK